MKKFIAFSGGVESSAMCLIFGNQANAIFADTGFEHGKLYEQIERVEKAVKEFHGNEFKVIRVKNKDYPRGLPEYIKHAKFYPSFRARFCTRMFKIEPIDNFLKQFDSAELMIGLNADEGEMRTGNHGLLNHVKYSYPLYENGITRLMCIQALQAAGIAPGFPAYMKRGGCIGCYMKSKKEFECMARTEPQEFKKVIDIEEGMQDDRKKFYAIRDSIPQGMKKFFEEVQRSPMMFDHSEVYPVINNATKCGVFCNR